ncbi:MAG: caspase family protein [Planctomycetes bacterium]|nr:caspase family protein [Planctomycetota bacterium]MBI3843237.1 caspase family protein [Planctomycetota bacterium]
MGGTVYALLVGIDVYPDPRHRLYGCVNDVNAFESYLNGRVGGDAWQIDGRVLRNAEATRQAIIDGFRVHLAKAGPEDVSLFYFSGHGSQETAPPEFWEVEPDRLDETLVCHDSRAPGGWDLADKELALLIEEIEARGPHVVVFLDCCHSGSGTRVLGTMTATRRMQNDTRVRPPESFLPGVTARIAAVAASGRGLAASPSGWHVHGSRHVLLAACRDDEEAKEYDTGGVKRGAFSHFVLETLQGATGPLTYRDAFAQAQNRVHNVIAAQSPQLETGDPAELDRPFLGGAIADISDYATIRHVADAGWVLDRGAIHAVQQPEQDETTWLALFPFDAAPVALRKLDGALGKARVVVVEPHRSRVDLVGIAQPDTSRLYKAVVVSQPLPPFGVRLDGDAAAVAIARDVLMTAGTEGKQSLFVHEDAAHPSLRLVAADGGYLITRPADDRPLVAKVMGQAVADARLAVARLEHIARWLKLVHLTNPGTRIPPGAVRLTIQSDGVDLQGSDHRLVYVQQGGKWRNPRFKVRVRNDGKAILYCALLALSEEYDVRASLFEGTGIVKLSPGEEAWACGGQPLVGRIPDELQKSGITETRDVIKVIACTAEFEPRLLEQGALPLPGARDLTRRIAGPPTKGTLNRLMQRVHARAIVAESDLEDYDDWTTAQVGITTVRPLETETVTEEGAVTVGRGVRVGPHPTLKAKVRLTTVTESSRDLGQLQIPAILRDDPALTPPLVFTPSRGADPGLSVLELTDVGDKSAVTSAHPLVLNLDLPIPVDEHVLPFAFDGEVFLPLGRVTQRGAATTSISIERLPEPVAEGTKSLTGSIRIFFRKILSEKLGIDFEYPILAAVDVGADGKVQYEHEVTKVRERVAAAERIVLVIHGIIGDTRGMAAMPLDGTADLVLAFDYENLSSPIQTVAASLKERLAAVGLGAGHGKFLQVVAHSMGGLVSRWFVEFLGGNRVVNRVVLCGTPNGGTPWSTVEEWATKVLGFAINGLTTVAWPVRVLSGLTRALESVDDTLAQMAPTSDFVKQLASGPDPHVPYTILAGNTSLIPSALGADGSLVARILQKLSPKSVLHNAASLAFFCAPNDIAASVASIGSVTLQREPVPAIREVACDHLTYFSSDAGRAALAERLKE